MLRWLQTPGKLDSSTTIRMLQDTYWVGGESDFASEGQDIEEGDEEEDEEDD